MIFTISETKMERCVESLLPLDLLEEMEMDTNRLALEKPFRESFGLFLKMLLKFKVIQI